MKFINWLFMGRESNWVYVKGVIAILIMCAVLAWGVVSLADAVNSEAIQACRDLSGEVTFRGYNCELPTGEIVEPVKYLAGR